MATRCDSRSHSRSTRIVLVVLLCSLILATPLTAHANTDVNWQKDAYEYTRLHAISTGGGVTIALIDSPINLDEATLKGANITIAGNFCPSPTGKGKSGASATGKGQSAAHSTAIANLLVGNGLNSDGSQGPIGIAPDAQLRVYAISDTSTGVQEYCASSGDSADQATTHSGQATIDALGQAIKDQVDIINLSLQTLRNADLDQAIEQAIDAGILVIIGSGNQGKGTINPLATIPGVITVAALTPDDEDPTDIAAMTPWQYSGSDDTHVAVAAIGDDLAAGAISDGRWDPVSKVSGTSFAAPLVTGLFALTKARYPSATASQLVENLLHTTTPEKPTFQERTGWGPVNPLAMLRHSPLNYPSQPFRLLDDTPQHLAAIEVETAFQQKVDDLGMDIPDLPMPGVDEGSGYQPLAFLGITASGETVGSTLLFGGLILIALGVAIALSRHEKRDKPRKE